jgi:ABC-type transporter Mla MlaB component
MVELTSVDALHHRVSGSPTLANAKEARALLDEVFARVRETGSNTASAVQVSLGGVTNGNSVLVSLMLVWMRRARAAGAEIQFVDVPPLVSNLIEFTGLDDVLPIARAASAA